MDNGLTKEEKLLIEEYKSGLDAYYRSETVYVSRENFFILAESIFAAAIAQLLKSDRGYLIAPIITGGIIFSVIWYYMQARSSRFSYVRVEILKQIENLLSRPSNIYPNQRIFAFFNKTEIIMDLEGKKGDLRDSIWEQRKYIPLIFLSIWISFLIILFLIH